MVQILSQENNKNKEDKGELRDGEWNQRYYLLVSLQTTHR